MKAKRKFSVFSFQFSEIPQSAIRNPQFGEAGFTLTELLIAMMVFTVIMGSVITLLTKSQHIFTTEQSAAETNQNGRMLIDFLTRDVQQSKENGLGLGDRFRSVYSYNGPEGKTDELTIVSSETDSKVPSKALPLIAASLRPFNARSQFVEVLPNGAGHVEPPDVVNTFKPDEEFIISSVHQDGAIQFDFIKIKSARLTNTGTIGLSFEPIEHKGVQPEIPLGSDYEGGGYTLRPVAIKRYFVDKADKEHPSLTLSINDGAPITIARNVTAFQLRYLEVAEGEANGQWVKQQNISSKFKTQAIEVTMTAKADIARDNDKEPQVTLASVIRPRQVPSGAFGSSSGSTSPGIPGGDGNGNGGNGGSGYGGGDGNGGPGDGSGGNGFGGGGTGNSSGNGSGNGFDGNGTDNGGTDRAGYNHVTRRIGSPPKLGQRLNPQ